MDKNSQSSKFTIQQIKQLTEILLPLPRSWLVFISAVVLLSLFEATRAADGSFTVTFRLTSTTAILVALVWLPTLLRVMALLGGGVKTTAGEVSTTGLLALLPKILATLDTVELNLNKEQQIRVREVRQEAEVQLAALSHDAEQARRELTNYAREYEEVRQTMTSGGERTFIMSTLGAKVRAAARQANYTPEEIKEIFNFGLGGDRIVALELLRVTPYPICLDLVLQAIASSRSAFEQYQALRVAASMLPSLTVDQKQQLKKAITDQRSETPLEGKHIIPQNADRWELSTRILHAIG